MRSDRVPRNSDSGRRNKMTQTHKPLSMNEIAGMISLVVVVAIAIIFGIRAIQQSDDRRLAREEAFLDTLRYSVELFESGQVIREWVARRPPRKQHNGWSFIDAKTDQETEVSGSVVITKLPSMEQE